MKITVELSDLTPNDIKGAIRNKDEGALRDLIFAKYEEAKEKNIRMEFYYGDYVACSDEVFDMFSYGTIKNIFQFYGYEVGYEIIDADLEIGHTIVSKDGFSFSMYTECTMHDSMYANFVDTKTAKIITKPSE